MKRKSGQLGGGMGTICELFTTNQMSVDKSQVIHRLSTKLFREDKKSVQVLLDLFFAEYAPKTRSGMARFAKRFERLAVAMAEQVLHVWDQEKQKVGKN